MPSEILSELTLLNIHGNHETNHHGDKHGVKENFRKELTRKEFMVYRNISTYVHICMYVRK